VARGRFFLTTAVKDQYSITLVSEYGKFKANGSKKRAKEQKQDRPKQGKPLVEVFAQEMSKTPLLTSRQESVSAEVTQAHLDLKRERAPGWGNPARDASGSQSVNVQTKEIELLEALSLKPIATNPRRHSRDNVAKIARSIQTYGWTTPVLITDALEVIAGHGRLLAAKQLGQDQIPCIRLSHLTPELVEAYRIADNRLALDSEWDDQLLTEAIRRLSTDPGFDLGLTGFDQDEIEDFLFIPGTGLTGEDDVPEPEAEVVAALGDIWQLGDHRLMCGDCTSPVAVSRLLEGAAPVIMVTDPPYGVQYDATWRRTAGINHNRVSIRENAPVLNDDRADWREAWALFHGPIAYVWHSGIHGPRVAESLLVTGLELRSQIVWVKDRITIGRGHYHWQHEGCWYAVRRGSTAHWEGGRDQSTVWEFKNLNFASDEPEDTTEGHSTQKPAECMRRPLLNHTRQGELAYDPFMGSGTTLIAAESTGRRAYGLEINPGYVDITLRRWQAYTGNVARLAGDGRTFTEVAEWRQAK
jgi:DNA modification methylase